MLRAILNKSRIQHPKNQRLYGHLSPITKTIKIRRTRHTGHCWRGRDELIRDVLLWIPTYGRAKAGWPARTYIQQLCEDTGCSPEDQPEAMNDREELQERVRNIRADSATWWWWWWLHPIFCTFWVTYYLALWDHIHAFVLSIQTIDRFFRLLVEDQCRLVLLCFWILCRILSLPPETIPGLLERNKSLPLFMSLVFSPL